MNAPSVDIKDILEAESSLGLTYSTDLFIGKEPTSQESQDNCVTIFDTGEFPPQLTLTKGENYYYPTIQIRVRNNAYITGYNLINNIRDALHARNHETWNNTVYELIECASGPAFLDWDENKRARFIVNFNIQRHT
ncbi:MAG: minor capsid protein [Methylococcaceae bacterium]